LGKGVKEATVYKEREERRKKEGRQSRTEGQRSKEGEKKILRGEGGKVWEQV